MKRSAICTAAAALLVSACTGGAQQTGIDVSQDLGARVIRNISLADLRAMQATCSTAAPAVAVAVAPGTPTPVKDIGVYGDQFCRQILAAQVTADGHVISTAPLDAGSPAWLGKVLAGVSDAAQVARVVLPIALKALPLVAGAL